MISKKYALFIFCLCAAFSSVQGGRGQAVVVPAQADEQAPRPFHVQFTGEFTPVAGNPAKKHLLCQITFTGDYAILEEGDVRPIDGSLIQFTHRYEVEQQPDQSALIANILSQVRDNTFKPQVLSQLEQLVRVEITRLFQAW